MNNIVSDAESQSTPGVSMRDLLTEMNFSLPHPGDVLEGEILSVNKSAVLIDLGAIGTGIVYPGEFYDNPNLQKSLKVGMLVQAVLINLDDEEQNGYRELSLKSAQQTTAWGDIKNKKDSGEIVKTKVVNINKGGLIVEVNGIQGFLPLSQLSPEHYPKVEGGDTTKIVQTLQKYRNQEFAVKIIDFSEHENRLIVSEKAINDEKIKEELARLIVGDIVKGEITDVTDFGAFMLIQLPGLINEEAGTQSEDANEETEGAATASPRGKGKIEGLIHISEIDWKIIENPRDTLSPGMKMEAKIISVENGKVSLSLKALKPDPWATAIERYAVGAKIKGKIVKATNYGALVSLNDEIIGLIPISEFGNKRPSEVLEVGSTVEVSIVSMDPKEHKMLLAMEGLRNELKKPEK